MLMFVLVTQKRYGNVTFSDNGNVRKSPKYRLFAMYTIRKDAILCSDSPYFFHGYRKNSLSKKNSFFCRLCKNVWITCCTHMTSHATWVDEVTRVMTSIKKIIENLGAVHMRWDGPATRAGSARWVNFHPAFIWNFLSHCKKLVASL